MACHFSSPANTSAYLDLNISLVTELFTTSSISEFVARRFDTDIAYDLGLSGRQRISVIFKIDKKGYVKDIRIKAPHPRLEKEAFRVINMLPKMKPGTQNGQPVIVPYSLPIVFQVEPSTTTEP